MRIRDVWAALCVWATVVVVASAGEPWEELRSIEKTDSGYRIVNVHAWMMAPPLPEPIPAEHQVVLVDIRASQNVSFQLYWRGAAQPLSEARVARLHAATSADYVTVAANLDEAGAFDGVTQYRLNVKGPKGMTFDVRNIRFVTLAQVPADLLPGLINLHCFTSKLHYLPGERIDYRATLMATCYPDRQSSKILNLAVEDASGQVVATAFQQYGIRASSRFKEIQGVLELDGALEPGGYKLKATSTDQRSGLVLTSEHAFGVLGPDDPYVCDTPFKFLKDFSMVRGPKGRYHIFSITGDLFGDHGWSSDGQERTFSHCSSADLRHWTMHPPVISISDKAYPDGNGRFKDRNVWAPHVIEHDGKYWMFYTSINQHVSQTISLATSKDLFEWTEYEGNPVFSLEERGVANFQRKGWADCRDPMVFVDGGKFYIYVTANAKGPGHCGAVVVAESEDLIHWMNAQVAVRAKVVSESPQVWKHGNTYCMTTSSVGANTYTSDHPMTGWTPGGFSRPDITKFEKYVHHSPSYAEEVIRLPDGGHLMAALTFRWYGNSIYLLRIQTESDRPVGYESVFPVP